jgi:hypothetical protein
VRRARDNPKSGGDPRTAAATRTDRRNEKMTETSDVPAATPRGPGLRQLLELGVQNIPPEWRADLTAADGVTVWRLPYGYLMWVPGDPEESAANGDGVPGDLLRIQTYARALGCDFVLFDEDAEPTGELPIWEGADA